MFLDYVASWVACAGLKGDRPDNSSYVSTVCTTTSRGAQGAEKKLSQGSSKVRKATRGPRTCVTRPSTSLHANHRPRPIFVRTKVAEYGVYRIERTYPQAKHARRSSLLGKRTDPRMVVFTGMCINLPCQKKKREVTRAAFEFATLRVWNECATNWTTRAAPVRSRYCASVAIL